MKSKLYVRSNQSGFAIAEVVIAAGLLAILVILIGGLGQQVSSFIKRTTQTSAILELRSMTSSITRNPEKWLDTLRSSSATNGIYAGCIPDPKLNASTFKCPPVIDPQSLASNDVELSKIAGNYYHVASVPIVDPTGVLIAGVDDSPVYLNNEGRVCDNTQNINSCPFKSQGFLLRSNQYGDQDPGAVKFIIKVSKRVAANSSGAPPFKDQYFSVDIGEDWKKIVVAVNCPAGTIKMGYLSNNTPYCVNPDKPCPSNQFLVSVTNEGDPICKSIPTCADEGKSVVLDSAGTDFECVDTPTVCGIKNIFLGYFGGSGKPICLGEDINCPADHLQVGVSLLDESIEPQCVAVPEENCSAANKRLSFNGVAFVCQSDGREIACTGDDVLSGLTSDGEPVCVPKDGTVVGQQKLCDDPNTQYAYGIAADGKPLCKTLPTGSNGSNGSNGTNGTSVTGQCSPTQEMYGVSSSGAVLCRDVWAKVDPMYNIKKKITDTYSTQAKPLVLDKMPSFITCKINSGLILNYSFDQYRIKDNQVVYIYDPAAGYFLIYDATNGKLVSGNKACPAQLPINGSSVSYAPDRY